MTAPGPDPDPATPPSPPPPTGPDAVPSSPPPIPTGPAAQPIAPTPAPSLGQSAGMRLLLPVGRSGWAIVAGYAGLFALIVFPAPIALITGIIAVIDIRRSRRSPHPKHGMGRALFGIIMGALGTALLAWILIGAASAP